MAGLRLAQFAMNNSEFIDALTILQEMGNWYPDNFQLLMKKVHCHQLQSEWNPALILLEKITKLFPEMPLPKVIMASNLVRTGLVDEAEIVVEDLLKNKDGLKTAVLIQLALYYRLRAQRTEALIFFLEAAEHAENKQGIESAMLFAAEEYRNIGELENAEAICQEYISAQRSQMIRASIYIARENWRSASLVYEKVIRDFPENKNARYQCVGSLFQTDDFAKAKKLLWPKDGFLDESPEILLLRAKWYTEQEEYTSADEQYKIALARDTQKAKVLLQYSQFLLDRSEAEEAQNLLELHQDEYSSVRIIERQITIALRRGEVDKYDSLITEARIKYPMDFHVFCHEIHRYMMKGRYRKAIGLIDENPQEHRWHQARLATLKGNCHFYLYLYLYEYQQIEDLLMSAIAIRESPHLRTRLASLMMVIGKIDDAMEQFRIGTQKLSESSKSIKGVIPLKSHIHQVANDFRSHPRLCKELNRIHSLKVAAERMESYLDLVRKHPSYLGGAVYLLSEIRQSGGFAQGRFLPEVKSPPPIPFCIIQYWDSRQVPEDLIRISQSWKDLNPGFTYYRFFDKNSLSFIQSELGERHAQAFKNCEHPATQADYFRLAYLYVKGGVYSDADDICVASLLSWCQSGAEFIAHQEDFGSIGNNFLAARPGNRIIEIALNSATEKLLEYCNEGPWFKTGPGLLSSAVAQYIAERLENEKIQDLPLMILSCSELKARVYPHIPLSYKRSDRSWYNQSYRRKIKAPKKALDSVNKSS